MSRGALVVGGSRGIGRASAAALARQGFDPIVIGYVADDTSANAAAESVAALGVATRVLKADASTEEGIDQLGEAMAGDAIGAVVYSVGHRVLAPSLDLPRAELARALEVTLTGFVRTVQAAGTHLSEGGKIVGISGLSGLRAYSSMHLAMGTAKAASHHAMAYLAWELAGRGINLNMVCCGSVETEGVQRDLTPEQYEEFVTSARTRIPRGRIALPREVAEIVAFLCTPAADLIVGQVIVADGGETLR